jgi:putative ABC transport system substrate-binding protein
MALSPKLLKKVDAVLVHHDSVLYGRIREIVALAARHRTPAIYFTRECAELGGLISYGPDVEEILRQAGLYAGRILRGEKPADCLSSSLPSSSWSSISRPPRR